MPTLSIDIEARFAKFQDGLDKIGRDVNTSVGRMSKSFDGIKSAARGLIGTLVGFGAIRVFKGVIDDLDQLQTVSEKTGRSAQSLVGFALAAKTTGTDLDAFAKGLNKLNIALSGLASGKNAEIKDLLLQMGLGEFAKGAIDAEEALLQLADVFPRLSDADKARVALTFFGKAGQDLIPALDGGREALEKFILKGKQAFPNANKLAKDADEFKDSMDELSFSLKGSLLPALDAILPLMKSLAKAMSNIDPDGAVASFGRGIAEVFKVVIVLGANVAYVLNTIGKEIGGFAQQLKALAKFDFKTIKIIADEMKAQGVEGRKEIDAFTKNILFPDSPKQAKALAPRKPELALRGQESDGKKTRGRAAARDDSAQRLLEQQLKDFERSIDQERDLAQTRNDFLQRFYDDGLISLADYTRARGEILDESAVKQKLAIGSEIALLTASKKGKAGDDRIAIDTKINDLLEKQADLNLNLKNSQSNLFYDNTEAAKEMADALQRVNIEALRSKGDFEGAFRLEFSLNNREQLKKFETEAKNADTPEKRRAAELGVKNNDLIRDELIIKEQLAKLDGEANILRNDAADAEERINLAIQQGTTGTIEGGQQINALRERTSVLLTEQFEKMENIALLSKDPAVAEAMKAWNIEIERLNANLDPLRDKFQDTFSGAFGSFFEDLASGTTSVKDAFKGLLRDLQSQFLKFATDDIFKKFFSKQGAGGGVVDFATSLFSGQGQGQAAQTQASPSLLSGGTVQAAAGLFAGGGSGGSAGKGVDAAAALTGLAESTTVSTAALKTFADDGLANATGNLFENVAATTAESTVSQTATGALTTLTISAEAAAAALASMATNAAISGAVGGAAGVAKAEGGLVTGAGSGTSDSIPAMLSNQEFVIRAKSTKEPRAMEFLTRFNKYGMAALKKYAAGGMVGRTFAMPVSAAGNLQMAGGNVALTQNFTVQASTPRETQQQFASAAYQGGVRAFRRNR